MCPTSAALPEVRQLYGLVERSFAYDVMLHATDGTLDQVELQWDRRFALGVVVAAGGYPLDPKKESYQRHDSTEPPHRRVCKRAATIRSAAINESKQKTSSLRCARSARRSKVWNFAEARAFFY